MSDPTKLPVTATPEPVGPLTCEPEAAVEACFPSFSPPEFGLEASPMGPEVCDPGHQPVGPPTCEVKEADPIRQAILTAYANTDHSWAKKQLDHFEDVLPAIHNVVKGSGGPVPVSGSAAHWQTYESWGLKNDEVKGLKALYESMWSGETPAKRIKTIKKAKSSFKSLFSQVRAFGKGKKWAAIPGFVDLMNAVQKGIVEPMEEMERSLQAQLPASHPSKKSKSGGGGGKGMGGGKGYNRKKVTDLHSLPGLDKASGPEPAEGSLAAQVEANMNRDVKVVDGSVDDFLYTNIPDLVSGKGKSKKAMKAWALIRNYRNKHLNPIFEQYSKDPKNEELKAEMDKAIATMESEIGKEVRDLIKAMWVTDNDLIAGYRTETEGVEQETKSTSDKLKKEREQEGFEAKSMDKDSYVASCKSLTSRIYKVRAKMKETPVPKDYRKEVGDASYKAMSALGKAKGQFATKHLRDRHLDKAAEYLTAAEEHLKELNAAYKKAEEAGKKEKEKVQKILDKIDDPAALPLVKPVKRHQVKVEVHGHDGADDVVTARYKTKHESKIGVYENVWSPIAISDKKGSFNRPKGAKRGAAIYDELKDHHGFTKSEAKILGSISTGEGDYHSLNTVDMMRISLGMIQFAGTTFIKLLHDLQKIDPTYYKKQFGQYGLLITKGMPKSEIPATVDRKDRHVPGAEHGRPLDQSKAAYKQWHDMLVVYDHRTREWVKGLEAMAVLQSDPRYLALIQESGRDQPVQLLQIKTAGSSFLRKMRTKEISYATAGIKDQPKGSGFQLKEVFNSETAFYPISASAVAGGTDSGMSVAKKAVKALVKGEGIKTPEELKAVDQATVAKYVRKVYEKWGRPTKLGEAIGSPLSDTEYSGKP